jgi:hypothetical protein
MNKSCSFNNCKNPVSIYNYRQMFINASMFIIVSRLINDSMLIMKKGVLNKHQKVRA